MKLKVIGTGSKGNCYVLTDIAGNQFILDAGVGFLWTLKYLRFNLKNVEFAFISHSHQDHFKEAHKLKKAFIEILAPSQDVADALEIEQKLTLVTQNFVVSSFKLLHDVECFGCIVYSKVEKSSTLYITDTSEINYKFKNVNHFIVEANHGESILDEKMFNSDEMHLGRVRNSHLSIEQTVQFLKASKSESMQSITLIHLSDSNSNEKEFKKIVEMSVGIPCNVAENGKEINL